METDSGGLSSLKGESSEYDRLVSDIVGRVAIVRDAYSARIVA